jgi:hypothetical protein
MKAKRRGLARADEVIPRPSSAVRAQAQTVTVKCIEVVVRASLDPIENAFTTLGLRAIIIIVRLFLSFFSLFMSGQMGGNMTHIALLGDSIIDNKA